MEKAILKTLIYADIFDYPLKVSEMHKWLIGKKATLRQVEAAIGRLVQSGHYFLPGSCALIYCSKKTDWSKRTRISLLRMSCCR